MQIEKFKLFMYRVLVIFSRVFLIIGTMTCSHWNLKSKHKTTDPQFIEHIERFEKLTNRKVNLNIGFEELFGSTIGICYYRLVGNEISISPKQWTTYNDYQKEALIFHELIHCICYKMHTDDILLDGCPVGYKTVSMTSTSCLQIHRYEYIENMKQLCSKE